MKALLSLSNIRTVYRIVKDIQKDLKNANLNPCYLNVKVDFRRCLEYIQGISYYGYDQDRIMINTYNFLASLRGHINDVIEAKMQLTLSQFKDIYKLNKELTSLVDQIHCLRPNYNFRKYTFKELMTNAYSLKWSHENLLYQLNDKIYHAERQLRSIQREEARLEREAKEALIRMQIPLNGYKFTIAQIRLINQKTNLGNYSLKEFITICLDRDIDDIYKVLEVIESLNNGYLTIETLEDNEYFYHEDRYYNNDEYCLTLEGDICDRDNCSWCEESDEYTSDPVTLRGILEDSTIARSVARESYYVCSWNSDLYYTEESAEYYGLYINEYGEVVDEDPDQPDPDDYLEAGCRDHIFHKFTDDPKFYIGLEVEKEDRDVLTSEYIDDFLMKTDYLFMKVSDCSLDRDSGYELKSPAMELLPQEIDKFLSSYPTIVNHINGDYSLSNCGGHINLSEVGLNGEEFFDKVKGYVPLFYALNPTRIDAYWSKAKSTTTLKNEKRKAQAIAIWDDRIELRIFSAVEDYNQLLWRVELCKLICDNPTDCFKQAFFNCHTVLKAHLEKGLQNEYFDPRNEYKNYNDFIDAIVKHTLDYENVDLNA